MLEILLLVGLSKGVGAIVQKKGRKPLGYKLMLVAFWIMGEIGGFVVAGVVTAAQGKEELDLSAYVFALVGAACRGGRLCAKYTWMRSTIA